jgi:hypothetical protein
VQEALGSPCIIPEVAWKGTAIFKFNPCYIWKNKINTRDKIKYIMTVLSVIMDNCVAKKSFEAFQRLQLFHVVWVASVFLGRTFRNLIQMVAEKKGYSNLLENNPEVLNLGRTAAGVRVDNYNGS